MEIKMGMKSHLKIVALLLAVVAWGCDKEEEEPVQQQPVEIGTPAVGRIQSLVYVPEVSDGRIHTGGTYVEGAAPDGSRQRIELIPPEEMLRITYRVSPIDIRDSLVGLYERNRESFSFYMTHVTESPVAADGLPAVSGGEAGTCGLVVTDVERGSEEGTLVVSVENDHDFDTGNIAVALSIRQTTEAGAYGFTSAYTAIVNDGGRDITGNFRVARKDPSGRWSDPGRDFYTVVYKDESEIVLGRKPMESEDGLMVVYDNDGSLISIEEAAEAFGWSKELSGSLSTPGNPKLEENALGTDSYEWNRETGVFRLKNGNERNVGRTFNVPYTMLLSGEGVTVTAVSDYIASVLVLPETLTFDEVAVTWSFGKWNTKKWMEQIYTSSPVPGLSYDDGTIELPRDIAIKLLANTTDSWLGDKSGLEAGKILYDPAITVNNAIVDGLPVLQVAGWKYNGGVEEVPVSAQLPTDGSGTGIEIRGILKFVGPSGETIDLDLLPEKDRERFLSLSTDPEDPNSYTQSAPWSAYPLLYLTASTNWLGPDSGHRIIPYSKEEVETFFDGDGVMVGNLFLTGLAETAGTLTCKKVEDFGGDGPSEVYLSFCQKGGRPQVTLSMIIVAYRSDIKNMSEPTRYRIPEGGLRLKVPDGPTYILKGTFGFVPKPKE